MSVHLCVPPYEFSDDLGPDDLSDVDLDHPVFRAAFPDGKVPIRHVPSPYAGHGDGFFAWAENVLGVHDAVRPYDVDAIARVADELVNLEVDGGDQDIADTNASLRERKRLVGELMASGMTLRQIHRYTGLSLRAVAAAATTERTAARSWVDVILCDEAIVEFPNDATREQSRVFELDQVTVRGLKRLRQGLSYNPRSDAPATERTMAA